MDPYDRIIDRPASDLDDDEYWETLMTGTTTGRLSGAICTHHEADKYAMAWEQRAARQTRSK